MGGEPKMKKRFFMAMIAAAVAMVLLCGGALACTQQSAEVRKLYDMVDQANEKIDRYVWIAKLTPYDDVDWLLWKVDRTVAPVFRYAQQIGATVVCEYRAEWIDGRSVYVDPLKVINVGTEEN